MSDPLIGITLDSEQPGGYSKFPWYAVRENYCTRVTAAGGLPLLLPHEPAQVRQFLDTIDALIVTGGAFDVDPALFGAGARHGSGSWTWRGVGVGSCIEARRSHRAETTPPLKARRASQPRR